MRRAVLGFCLIMMTIITYGASPESLYQAGRYDEARQQYELFLEQHPDNAAALYNLGNVYFKKGELGEAMVYYLRSEAIQPRNADLKFNMRHIQNRIQDRFSPSPFSVFFLKRLVSFVTVSEAVILFCLPLSVFLGVLGYGLFKHVSVLERPIVFFGSLFLSLVAGLFLLLVCSAMIWSSFGVIIDSKVPLKSGPSETLPTQGYVHEGTTIRVQSDSGLAKGWSKITLPNGIEGWIRNEQYWQVVPR